jgi:hypothetical protein
LWCERADAVELRLPRLFHHSCEIAFRFFDVSCAVPSLVWWNFPMTLSGDFDGSLSGGEVKRLSELSAERAPAVDLP